MFTPVFLHSTAYTLKQSINYSDGAIVSKIVTKSNAGNITLFAFDKGQNLSKHSAPFDAIIQILEGKGRITIDNDTFIIEENQMIIMPANIPHAVDADEKFKMMLIMIKG
ncbi:MAG: cupin domain-containing protein [Marinilabiliaceae bacterium]|nr:cupin domain-containing protein [Marinilabiliaceae bacterium]